MSKKLIAGCISFMFILLLLLFNINSAFAARISLEDYEVLVGQNFDVDVLIDTEGAMLAGFEFDIDIPSFITPLSITDGGFLPAPYYPTFPALLGQIVLTPPEIGFYNFNWLPGGATGVGVLATITFHADEVGFGNLELNDVLLSDPSATPISYDTIHGSVNVVPEPSTLILLCFALPCLICLRKKILQ